MFSTTQRLSRNLVARIAALGLAAAIAGCGTGTAEDEDGSIVGGGGSPTPTPVDNQAPDIAILSPDNDGRAETSQSTIAVTGRATDDGEVSELSWNSNRGGSGTIAVSENWRSPDITLFEGSNIITVTAEDMAGNRASDSITIVRQVTPEPDDALAMVSFDPTLSNAAMLEGNTVARQQAYLFFEPSAQWDSRGVSRVEFSCCRAITGTAEPHRPVITVSAAPWVLPVNLSEFQAGTRRELYIDVFFADGTQGFQSVEFNLANSAGGSNGRPVITGSAPGQVTVGEVYSFIPTATDPDGDMLTFSVLSLPRWASFDPASGQVSGTPGPNDVGRYPNVRIAVTDGIDTAFLPGFTIDVEAIAPRAVTLNWTPPTVREDGSPLNGLSGYRVYYGTSPGVYPNNRDINDGSVSSYVLDNLAPDVYYIAITSIDLDGLESALSNEAVKDAS